MLVSNDVIFRFPEHYFPFLRMLFSVSQEVTFSFSGLNFPYRRKLLPFLRTLFSVFLTLFAFSKDVIFHIPRSYFPFLRKLFSVSRVSLITVINYNGPTRGLYCFFGILHFYTDTDTDIVTGTVGTLLHRPGLDPGTSK